jgi:hypothetical protein
MRDVLKEAYAASRGMPSTDGFAYPEQPSEYPLPARADRFVVNRGPSPRMQVSAFWERAERELTRARAKHPGEEGRLTDAEWLAVLTEEVGECARAIQDETDDALREELVQVAAMAKRWYESIPLGRARPPWAGRA